MDGSVFIYPLPRLREFEWLLMGVKSVSLRKGYICMWKTTDGQTDRRFASHSLTHSLTHSLLLTVGL